MTAFSLVRSVGMTWLLSVRPQTSPTSATLNWTFGKSLFYPQLRLTLQRNASLKKNGYEAVVYFNQYVYQISALLGAKCGVKHFTLSQPGHRGIDYRRLIVIEESTSRKIPREQRNHGLNASVPLDSTIIGEIGTDILTRFGVGGSHVFFSKTQGSTRPT